MNVLSTYGSVGINAFYDKFKKLSLVLLLTVSVCSADNAFANPTNPQVSSGTVNFSAPDANTLNVTQSTDKAIINWGTFNINSNEATHFIQPSSSSVALNRVTGSTAPSQILGTLTANGQIFLINPAGIFFGKGATVDVAGLVASTANISDANFLAGNFKFTNAGTGSIINQGNLIAAEHGLIALLGNNVSNEGTITANLGNIVLASGNAFTLDFSGDQLINFKIDSPASAGSISNSGTLLANGGKILLNANVAQTVLDNVINMTGIAVAHSVGIQNGQVVLLSSGDGIVNVSGTIDVSGINPGESGGLVQILGKDILLNTNSLINANGDIGGGNIFIGGGARGATLFPDVANADAVVILPTAQLHADAITQGNGGDITIWGTSYDKVAGTLTAMGGALSGNGGLIETSTHGVLDVASALVNTLAPLGLTGEWLLDPYDVTISTSSTSNGSFDNGNPNTFTPTGTANILNTDIQNNLLTTDVTIQTTGAGSAAGNITVNAPITWNTATTLTLHADDNTGYIFLNAGANITAHNGTLVLSAANLFNNFPASTNTITSTSNPTVGVEANIDVANFNLLQGVWFQINPTLPTFHVSNQFTLSPYNGFVYNNNWNMQFVRFTGGDGSSGSPYQIADVFGLQGMITTDLGKSYELVNNIDASVTVHWVPLAGFINGFTVIGLGQAFEGTFDGQNHTISNLYSAMGASADLSYQGLFGQLILAQVSNLGIISANLSAPDPLGIGALAGQTDSGTVISNVYSQNSQITSINPNTSGGAGIFKAAGGLVGNLTSSTLENSYVVGGSVTATGVGDSIVGGLVGWNALNENETGVPGIISQSYANTTVSSSTTGAIVHVGGLVGRNSGSITDSYSQGTVSGVGTRGGLVGSNDQLSVVDGNPDGTPGTITHSYSTTLVNAGSGGFLGEITAGSVTNSFWDTNVSGTSTGIVTGSSAGVTGGCFSGCGHPLSAQATFTGWDFSSIWGIVEGKSYPYLLQFYPSTPQVFSGVTYSDSGNTHLSASNTISIAVNGSIVDNVVTGANGFYYFLEPHGTVPNGDAVLTFINNGGSNIGNTIVIPSNGGSLTSLDIYGNTIRGIGTNALSNASIATAIGSLSNTNILLSYSGLNLTIANGADFIIGSNAQRTPYTLDGNITHTSNGRFLTFNGPVSLSNSVTLSINATSAISFADGLTGNAHNITLQGHGGNNAFGLQGTLSNIGTITVTDSTTGNNGDLLSILPGGPNLPSAGVTVTPPAGTFTSLSMTNIPTVNGTVFSGATGSSSSNASSTPPGGTPRNAIDPTQNNSTSQNTSSSTPAPTQDQNGTPVLGGSTSQESTVQSDVIISDLITQIVSDTATTMQNVDNTQMTVTLSSTSMVCTTTAY